MVGQLFRLGLRQSAAPLTLSRRPLTRALMTAMRTAQPIAQLAPLSKVEMAILPARTCELASPTDLATMPIPRNRPPHLPKMTSPAL